MGIRLRATTTLAAVSAALMLAVVLIVERGAEASMSDAIRPTPNQTYAEPQATSCLKALREPSLGLRPIALVADCERIDIGGFTLEMRSKTPSATLHHPRPHTATNPNINPDPSAVATDGSAQDQGLLHRLVLL
jgi:hypothetical protein